jgi:hypothetical protein
MTCAFDVFDGTEHGHKCGKPMFRVVSFGPLCEEHFAYWLECTGGVVGENYTEKDAEILAAYERQMADL